MLTLIQLIQLIFCHQFILKIEHFNEITLCNVNRDKNYYHHGCPFPLCSLIPHLYFVGHYYYAMYSLRHRLIHALILDHNL